jgi:hypothetical protein
MTDEQPAADVRLSPAANRGDAGDGHPRDEGLRRPTRRRKLRVLETVLDVSASAHGRSRNGDGHEY